MFARVLLCIGDVKVSVDLLHIEWSETLGDLAVMECGRAIIVGAESHGIETVVVDFDVTRANIRNVQEKWPSRWRHLRDGGAFVHRAQGRSRMGGVIQNHEGAVGRVFGVNS